MVDSRQKGVRAEYQIRDLLKDHTKLSWERVPNSGGFGASHGLKGDVYLPQSTGYISNYTIEVKAYANEAFDSNVFKSTRSNLGSWWEQTVREAEQMKSKPLLVFKKDRGIWIGCMLLEDWSDVADKMTGVNIILNKFGDSIVMFHFNELVTKAPHSLYRSL